MSYLPPKKKNEVDHLALGGFTKPDDTKKQKSPKRPQTTMAQIASNELKKEPVEVEVPLTELDKQAFQAQIREIEVTALVRAASSSLEETETQGSLDTRETLRKVFQALPLVLGIPYVWCIKEYPGHQVVAFGMVYFLATLGIWFLADPPLPYGKLSKKEELERRIADLRRCSTSYLQVYQSARHLAHKVEYASRKEILSDIQSLSMDLNSTDNDYQPSVRMLERARVQVKYRLEEEIDPQKLLVEDFNNRLSKHTDSR